MNQIVSNNMNNNCKSTKYNKEHSIPIFAIIIPLIIILFMAFSFNIYATNENKLTNTLEEDNYIDRNSVTETTKTQDNNISSSNENIEEKQEELEEGQNDVKTETKEILYTADNGETYNVIGKLNIPSLNIEYAILSSSSTELLKVSLNRYWGSYPNEMGNMVVIGHNYKNNKFFSNLPNIQIGDIVKITDTKGKTLNYSVYDTSVIDPYDNSCTSQLTDGHTEITLITCYYENGSKHATKRFVAKARAY